MRTKRCLEAGCRISPNAYQNLPSSLKDKLLVKLTERGICGDESLHSLAYPHLQILDLRKCSVSEESLLSIEYLKELRWLHLPQPPHVISQSYSETALVKVIGEKCNLLSLGMSGLHGVTDKVIRILVKSSEKLELLNLKGTLISDESLFFLRNLQNLSDLNIAKTKVTDSGIEEFASGDAIKSLVFICLRDCNQLTKSSLKSLLISQVNLCIFPEDLSPNMSVLDVHSIRYKL